MCPPLRPVAPEAIVLASNNVIRESEESQSRDLATEQPVMPDPRIRMSVSEAREADCTVARE